MVFQVGPMHLDPSHRTIAVLEAPSIEVVTKLVFDIGLSQWNDVEVCVATPSAERVAQMDDFPIVFDD